MRKKLATVIFIIFGLLVLSLSARGILGNPQVDELNTPVWIENGPFELSPERGRLALTISLAENKSLFFSPALTAFSEPDVGFLNGQGVSLFAPGLSFITLPGYFLGKAFGFSTLGPVIIIALFALVNAILIKRIAELLGAETIPAILASMAFLFGTPAFTYSVTLYQHHLSLFCLLASIYLYLGTFSFINEGFIWLLCGIGFAIDYPNIILMLPIISAVIVRWFVQEKTKNITVIKIKFHPIMNLLFSLLPLFFLFLFNKYSYGNPFMLSGAVPRKLDFAVMLKDIENIQNVSSDDQKTYLAKKFEVPDKNILGFFSTRDLLNGFYIHLLSPDRGVIFYAPVVLLGLGGLYLAYQKKLKTLQILTSIAGINIIVYSLWGDPWGGWAFGSRYLIPLYSVLAIFLALFITWVKHKQLLFLFFLILFGFSVGVNTLGALTSSKNPPQVEVLALEKITKKVERYNWTRNLDYLYSRGTKSAFYRSVAGKYLTPVQYYQLVVGLIFFTGGGLSLYYWFLSRNGKN